MKEEKIQCEKPSRWEGFSMKKGTPRIVRNLAICRCTPIDFMKKHRSHSEAKKALNCVKGESWASKRTAVNFRSIEQEWLIKRWERNGRASVCFKMDPFACGRYLHKEILDE